MTSTARNMAIAIGAAAIAAGCAWGQNYKVRIDTQYPQRELMPLAMLEGTTPNLVAEIYQAGALNTNIVNHTAAYYMSTGRTGVAGAFVVRTGSTVNARSGTITIPLTVSDTSTNGGPFWYTILLRDSTGRTYYSGSGSNTIQATSLSGSALLTLGTASSYLTTNSPDGTTIIYTNGALSAIAAAAPDLVARADISALKTGKVDRVDTNGWEVGAHTGYVPRSETGTLVNAGALALDIAPLEDATGALNAAVGVLQTATGALNNAVAARITDAPSDGIVYGRSNANWVAVGAGGGSETDPVWTGSGHATNTLAAGAHGGLPTVWDSPLNVQYTKYGEQGVWWNDDVLVTNYEVRGGTPGGTISIGLGPVNNFTGPYGELVPSIYLTATNYSGDYPGSIYERIVGGGKWAVEEDGVEIVSVFGGTLGGSINADTLDGSHASAFQPAGSYLSSIGLYSNSTHVGSVTGLSVVGASAVTVAGGVGTVTIPPDVDAAGGHSGITNRFFARMVTTQTFSNAWSPIRWDTEIMDPNDCFQSQSNVIFGAAGWCFINFNHNFGAIGAGKAAYWALYKNAEPFMEGAFQNGANLIVGWPQQFHFWNDASTNVYNAMAYQNDSASESPTVYDSGKPSYLWISGGREL